jgi:uncharacterized protein (TIGR03790 family)
VPLKIGALDENVAQLRARNGYLQSERAARVGRLADLIATLSETAADNQADAPPDWAPDTPLQMIQRELEQALVAVRARIAGLEDPDARKTADLTLGQSIAHAGGLLAAIDTLARQQAHIEDVASRQSQVDAARGRLTGLQEGRTLLEQLPESVERDQQVLALVERIAGLLGSLQWIDAQLQLLSQNESAASFDSELSLLYWPPYPLLRWQPNVLHYRFDASYDRWLRTTLMVSRLEAPTLELTQQLVDAAMQQEQAGLSGTVYLDGRGGTRDDSESPAGSYAEFDASLAKLADFLQAHTDLPVKYDKGRQLFQPGDCPDAALYCGWYSLRKYVDAFDWKPGAVAYHIASAEATTLRDRASEAWCKRLLEDGVCATLGPTFEPYLAAFPKPDEFFVLLLSGRYTLAECYYRCQPFNSWAMVLVGDPLYNPFAAQPQFDPQTLPAQYQALFEDDAER